MAKLDIPVIDAFDLTLSRPDHTEITKEQQIGSHLVHHSWEVNSALNRMFFAMVLQRFEPWKFVGCLSELNSDQATQMKRPRTDKKVWEHMQTMDSTALERPTVEALAAKDAELPALDEGNKQLEADINVMRKATEAVFVSLAAKDAELVALRQSNEQLEADKEALRKELEDKLADIEIHVATLTSALDKALKAKHTSDRILLLFASVCFVCVVANYFVRHTRQDVEYQAVSSNELLDLNRL
jgi:hypothetical protein